MSFSEKRGTLRQTKKRKREGGREAERREEAISKGGCVSVRKRGGIGRLEEGKGERMSGREEGREVQTPTGSRSRLYLYGSPTRRQKPTGDETH